MFLLLNIDCNEDYASEFSTENSTTPLPCDFSRSTDAIECREIWATASTPHKGTYMHFLLLFLYCLWNIPWEALWTITS